MSQKSLLTVLAHPDDESFGPGGTLAKYAAAGVDVHIVIATDGAAGSVVEGYEEQRSELAAVRAEELRKAVAILGCTLHTLDYRDSGYIGDENNKHPDAFINQDLDQGVRQIVSLIRELRPQVVMTHDETGGYYHPDHIRCYEITTAAFDAAGDPEKYPDIGPAPYRPERLYYSAFPNTFIKFFIFFMRLRRQDPRRVGRNQDIDMTRLGHARNQLHARINVRDSWETKQRAGAEHGSQGGGGLQRRFPRFLQRWLFGYEYFIRAYPLPLPSSWEPDLFGD